VPDRRIVVLRLASPRADSKCRGLIAKSIADNSPRLDSTVAMTCHRSSPSSAAAPILPPIGGVVDEVARLAPHCERRFRQRWRK
jgi:hypothetical protein